MNAAILILAATSAPMGFYALMEFASRRSAKGVFGVVAATWSVAGVFLVSVGIPGVIFFPGLVVIVLLGTIVQLRVARSVALVAKASLAALALILATVGMVLL